MTRLISRALQWVFGLGFLLSLAVGTGRSHVPLPWTWLFVFSFATLVREWGKDPAAPARTERLLFWSTLAAYLSTFRWHGGDDIPGSLIPFSLLKYGTLSLDPYADWLTQKGLVDFFVKLHGHYLSAFPIAPSLMVAPLYVLPAVSGAAVTELFLHNLSKIGAAGIAAVSTVVFYRILASRFEKKWVLCVTLVYALGSYTFSVSSQALYQHGPAQLAMLVALWGLRENNPLPRDLAVSGFSMAWAVACRFDSLAFAAPLALGVLFSRLKKEVLIFALGGILPLVGLAAYYWHYTGAMRPPEFYFQAGLFRSFQSEAPLGMVFSPTRGLIPLFPVALFGFWGMLKKNIGFPAFWAASMGAGCLGTGLLFCFRPSWTGGGSFGNRYFAMLAGMLCLFCAQTGSNVKDKPVIRVLWSAAMSISILVHAIGAYFSWPGSFVVEEQKRRLWDWDLYPPIYLVSDAGPLAALGPGLRDVMALFVLGLAAFMAQRAYRYLTPTRAER